MVDEIEKLRAEIQRLRASELAWQLIAKQNDKWTALPQSEKELALHKSLDAVTSENVILRLEIETLRETLHEIICTEGCPRWVERIAVVALTGGLERT